jgi:hypothetical protein
MKGASFLSKFEVARATFKQPKLKGSLQFRNPSGQGRFGTAGRPRRFAEATVARDKVEIGKGTEIHDRSIFDTNCLISQSIGSMMNHPYSGCQAIPTPEKIP